MILPLRVSLFEAGAAGVPSTSVALLPPGDLVGYTHSITDAGGFESMEATFVTSAEDAQAWFAQGLMRSVVCSGPDGDTIWEGYISGVSYQLGQETRSVSLDTMSNRVRCKYTTVLGTPGTTANVSDTTSIAMYGTKDLVVALNADTATAAASKAARVLALYKQPRPAGSIGVATGDMGSVLLTISAKGWYSTLGWVVTSRSSTSSTSTTTQVGALIAASGVGIGVTNPFLNTSTDFIASSGNSASEFIEAETTYQEKIETLLDQGKSTGDALAWGVYESRTFYVETAADASPTTTQYKRSVADSLIYDEFSASPILWWQIRPNRMYQVREFLDTNPAVVAPDAAARSYIARVSLQVGEGQIALSLEGRSGDSLDRIVARMR